MLFDLNGLMLAEKFESRDIEFDICVDGHPV